jgi:hypothetical protein
MTARRSKPSPDDRKDLGTLVDPDPELTRSRLKRSAHRAMPTRMKRVRLAKESAKLDRTAEQAEADSFFTEEPAGPQF